VFVSLHIHFLPAKTHAFALQTETLFERVLSLQLDCASGAQDALPRDVVRTMESPRHQTSAARKACGGGYCAVRADFAVGDFRDCL